MKRFGLWSAALWLAAGSAAASVAVRYSFDELCREADRVVVVRVESADAFHWMLPLAVPANVVSETCMIGRSMAVRRPKSISKSATPDRRSPCPTADPKVLFHSN